MDCSLGGFFKKLNFQFLSRLKLVEAKTGAIVGGINLSQVFWFSRMFCDKVRGALVEWLDRLSYGAEYCRKACVRGGASTWDNWKTLSVKPAVNGYLFELGKDKAAKGDRWAPPSISCVQDTVGL